MIDVGAAMEARSADALPEAGHWWYEPKWDGFRCLATRDSEKVELRSKSGSNLTRYFPEVADTLAALPQAQFVLDGELLIERDGRRSFEALQTRLHPAASRVERLASETPAALMMFDMLMSPEGEDLRSAPFLRRRQRLEAFVVANPELEISPGTDDLRLARSWLADGNIEGVVAKCCDDPYLEGRRAMVKVKRARTADCVVGGFRCAAAAPLVASLLLGLYNDKGLLDHVGFTSGLAAVDKTALTAALVALGGGPGFTGARPGGPSRWRTERSAEWTPVRPELVVEVSFDHVSGGRFRHGTKLLRERPDKSPRQCRMDQITS